MADLRPGDKVFDERGEPCTVTFCSEVKLGQECYRIRFDDGETLVADAQHEWLTWTHAARKSHYRSRRPSVFPAVRSTLEILDTLRFGRRGARNHSVQLCCSVKLPDAALPIQPYVLGAWLGDGTSLAAELTTVDVEMLENLEECGCPVGPIRLDSRNNGVIRARLGQAPPKRNPETGRMVANESLQSKLRALGLLGRKRIPAVYLRASESQRLNLIAGLMDTDGSTLQRCAWVEFSNTNQEIVEGLAELVRSLGWKAHLDGRRAKLNGKDCGPVFRVQFRPDRQVFRLKRKASVLAKNLGKGQARRHTHRMVVAVDRVASVPVVCVGVNSPSRLFLAGRGFIPTHNTRPGSELVNFWAETMPKSRIALLGATAADVRDVMILGESGIIETAPPWFRPVYEPSKRRLLWPNGTQAFAYSTQEPERLRGPQHHKGWFDEFCAARKPEAWKQLKLGLRLPYDPSKLIHKTLGEYRSNCIPQCFISTTPKPQQALRELRDMSPACTLPEDKRPKRFTVAWTHGRTIENAGNLSPEFLEEIYRDLQGSRLGRQELDAELIEDAEGALWARKWIDDHRVRTYVNGIAVPLPLIGKRGVAIDPKKQKPVATGAEYGIVTGGICEQIGHAHYGHAYITGDYSGRLTAAQAYARVIEACKETRAQFIVLEWNRWGQEFWDGLVKAAAAIGFRLPPRKTVQVQEDKATRAEPATAPYEIGHAHHVDDLPVLEGQLCGWVPGEGNMSPDRLDALVHLIKALIPALRKPSRGSHQRPDGW